MAKLPLIGSDQFRPLGFSTGSLYRFMDSYSTEAIDLLAQQGLETIEFMCASVNDLHRLPALIGRLREFEVKSIHMPLGIQFDNTSAVHDVLKRLEEFYNEIGASLAVIHPESVDDWNIFDGLEMKFAIENLDNRKPRWFGFEQFEVFLAKHPDWSMVLDLNHCFTYDDKALRAKRYIERFGDRIAEIHLSGCDSEKYHCSLYVSEQKEIVDCLPQINCPIIIESVFYVNRGPELEIDFIKACQNHLK
ncbi:MAG: hypothetical protein WCT26_03340 [Candidatus Buchananbacteria bacterium]|jgi:hypothetical protein